MPTPTGKHKMAAAYVITPLIACLDPRRRFPIINGERGVESRLTKLDLVNRDLEQQAKGFIGLIGQFGIADAFAVDTMTEDQIEKIKSRSENRKPSDGGRNKGTAPHYFDEAERESVQHSRTVIYRQRHNKMTNRLQELLGMSLPPGNSANCRYDLLVANYDRAGRDLLIEAKPDTDMGSIRIAIGQLLDYRRFLPRQAVTDLAILTISRPPQDYVELLQDIQITPLWFPNERCQTLVGDGKIWKSLQNILRLNRQ